MQQSGLEVMHIVFWGKQGENFTAALKQYNE